MNRRFFLLIVLTLNIQVATAQTLPSRFSDQEFWKLSGELSEPDGSFRSDNLLSNEAGFQYLMPELQAAGSGNAYLGVGPEQNFTYIAALRPKIAFIIDIRRGNLNLQLLYKALFELSKDRADFVSRLFARKRPAGLGPRSTVNEMFTAYLAVEPNDTFYEENLQDIKNHLVKKHRFPLSANDLTGIEEIYSAFRQFGPFIDYNSSSGGTAYNGKPASYVELMTATDDAGQAHSYLASEVGFKLVKDLHASNLIIPVVGNFAGPKAIQAVGTFLKERNAVVSHFYLSNVEQYLEAGESWGSFCRNALTLPIDDTSTFIRAVPGRNGLNLTLTNMVSHLTLGTISCR